MAIIPNGSGNDLAATLTLRDPEKAVDIIIRGESVPIDAGKVIVDAHSEEELRKECKTETELRERTRYYFVVMGIGLLNRASIKSWNLKRYLGGPIAYSLTAIQDILVFERDTYSLVVDNETIFEN